MTDTQLLAIVAALVYAADTVGEAIVIATEDAPERETWKEGPRPAIAPEDITPAMTPAGAVAIALEIVKEAQARGWEAREV